MVSGFPVRFLLDGGMLCTQQLSHPQSFTERSTMLMLGIPKILLKLSFYVFYHGVFLSASQSSLNNAPPALTPQHAVVCFTVVLFGLYQEFPITQAKNRSGSSHWPLHSVKPSPSQLRLRQRQVLGPCTTRSEQSLVLSHANGKNHIEQLDSTINSYLCISHV